jgi:uncharacterized membrane protein YfcA
MNTNSLTPDSMADALASELAGVEENFNRAMISNDVLRISACVADDWVLITPEVGVVPRSRILHVIYTRLGAGALTRVLGGLLLLTAVAKLTGWTSRWQPFGALVGLFGLVAGFFGGIAGNQGGLRSAALTAFGLPPLGFVATATATGLLVDVARTLVYLWHSGSVLLTLWAPIIVATVGVLVGTIVGERMLVGLSPRRFGQTIGVAIGALGIWMLVMPA